MSWFAIGAGAVTLGVSFYEKEHAKKQAAKARQEVDAAGTYKENPLVRQQLALAQNQYNGRMEGATALEQNIFATQANTQSSIERNATDPNQVLALASSLQGGTNQALSDLQTKEAQDRSRRLAELENAQNGVINEGSKVFSDKIRLLEQKLAINGVEEANKVNATRDMASGIAGIAGGVATGYSNKAAGYGFGGSSYGSVNPYVNPNKPWYSRTPAATTSAYNAPAASIYANTYPG